MKSKIVKTAKPSSKLRISEDGTIIVMVLEQIIGSDTFTGVVVYKGDDPEIQIGTSHRDYLCSLFKPWYGTITITTQDSF